MRSRPRTPRRIRLTLLVLLWAWALCVFTVLDLFRNVSEFDGIRPRAESYRAMRYAAHRMVGEEYVDGDFRDEFGAVRIDARVPPGSASLPPAARSAAAARLSLDLDEVRELGRAGDVGRLMECATAAEDPRVRIAALRALTDSIGPGVRGLLVRTATAGAETAKVRREAARLLGRTADGAMESIDALLREGNEVAARTGAVLALGELGGAEAAERALGLADEPSAAMQQAVDTALSRMTGAGARPALQSAATDSRLRRDTRVAAVRALGGSPGGDLSLFEALLADLTEPPALRAAAADALGRLRRHEARAALVTAASDLERTVAVHARIARSSLDK